MDSENALKLLRAAGIFFYDDPSELDPGDGPEWLQMINLNDAFYWACSDCERVTDDELPELARLFGNYGMCGVYYWVLTKRGEDTVEFVDVNRKVEFVRHEEELRKKAKTDSELCYLKVAYTIGESSP